MSLRKAINDKCKECLYDQSGGGGNWRQQVTACTSFSCPLYPHRPVSRPSPTKSLTAPENTQIGPPADLVNLGGNP
jgi:hypothetical protein